jgi:hypothetical protein
MAEPLRVEAGETDTETVMTALDEGRRVLVTVPFAGEDHQVTLRFDGETYYCDTPTTLHKHDTAAEMRTCIEHEGYAE